MDKILIIGASGGIGSALTLAIRNRGFDVLELSRSQHGFDLTQAESVDAALSDLRDLTGIIVASGALEIDGAEPERSIRAISQKAMMDQFMLNAVGPALVLKHAPKLLRKDVRTICAVLTARVGSIGDNRLGGWVSYRAAKAAANQIVHTAAIELSRTHPKSVCVALHPGTVQTPFTKKYLGRHPAVPASEAAENIVQVLSRLTPQDSGGFFDWSGKEVAW